MDSIIRAFVIYAALLIIFRIGGKRTMAQVTPFDFVLLLVVGEATQQALLGNDFSITNAILVIATLVGIDILISLIKQHSKKLQLWTEGTPIWVVKNGKLQESVMKKERIDEGDILEEARKYHGIEDLSQIKHAILERSGGVTVIPYTTRKKYK